MLMKHRNSGTATHSGAGEARAYIDGAGLKQLWIHTGTQCNLRCVHCFERAAPGDARLDAMTMAEAAPAVDAAARLGVDSFGFTGGEPFVNKEFPAILEYALSAAPCLILSNGTEPLRGALDALRSLADRAQHPLGVRISLDTPDQARHDAERGPGRFAMALESLRLLHGMGIAIAVARRREDGENPEAVAAAYAGLFARHGLPDIPLTSFPDLLSTRETPEITENCLKTYHSPESRAAFMCAYSRMLLKRKGQARFYACTLVDDDPAYDFGPDLALALATRTLLRHKRCFACFSSGVSCGG